MFVFFFLISVVISITPLPGGERDINNLDQYNNKCRMHNVPGCTAPAINMKSDGTLYLTDAYPAPKNMIEICISEHPEFDPNVTLGHKTCCDEHSVLDLKEQSTLLDGSFGKCPACYLNQMNLWCGFACDPNSARWTEIDDFKHDNTCNEPDGIDVPSLYYYLHPLYAQQIYDSCKDTELSGGFAVRSLYPTYKEFFQMISDVNPVMPLHFVYDETGYNGSKYTEMHKCSDMCSCQSCHEMCTEFIEDEPTFKDYPFLDGTLNIITIISIHLFMLFIMVTITVCGGILSYKTFTQMKKSNPTLLYISYISLGAVTLLGIGFIIMGIIVVGFPMEGVITSMPWGDGNLLGMILLYIGFGVYVIGYSVYDLYYFVIYTLYNKKESEDIIDSAKVSILGQEESCEEDPNKVDLTDNFLSKAMSWYTKFLWKFKWIILTVVILCCIVLCVGVFKIVFITDSLGLWVPKNCQTMKDKNYYDEAFGPFFRINQFMLSDKLHPGNQVLTQPLIVQLQQMIDEIRAIHVEWTDKETGITKDITMDDMCYKPVFGKGCIITSVTGYWQHDINKIMNTENVTQYIQNCLGNPLATGCADDIGSPVDPHNSLGNYTVGDNNDPMKATILQATFMFNQPNKTAIEWAELWEEKYLEILDRDYSLVKVAYQAQRSVDDEINRETFTDVLTVLCSYMVMFIYISLSLGNSFYHFNYKTVFVKSRILLGILGIVIVLFSVFTSAGFFSWINVEATLIITEVIPFLVLAIGVDNIFILTNTIDEQPMYDKDGQYVPVEKRLEHSLMHVGPSMMLASISESLAFFLGYLTSMPAVQSFSLYAGLAIFIDFILQITVYAVLLCYDVKRQESHGLDFIPWLQVHDNSLDEQHDFERGSLIKHLFKYVATFLSYYPVKIIGLFFFIAFFIFSLNYVPKTMLGLPQETALPQDSYIQDYFVALTYLEIGPPVYIVVRDGATYLNETTQSALCASDNFGCDALSIPNYYDAARTIDGTTFDWIDDYFSWAAQKDCCRLDKDGNICPYDMPNYTECTPCFTNFTDKKRPVPEDFYKYINRFLTASINETLCSVNGQAYYPDVVWNHINGTKETDYSYVNVSRLRLYHTVLVTQDDFIDAMVQAYNISDYMNSIFDVKTFPYAYHYVYFQQYFNIVDLCVMDVCLALAAVFIVVMLLMFDPIVAIMIVLCVLMCVIDLIGIMYLWGVELNAVSCVNLVMSIGITIEFCVHIAHAFLSSPKKTLNDKMKDAVMNMGNNVFVGITLTKFLGVIVLSLSSGLIFVIYYFRMYFMMLIFGASHGLFFLPILLSLIPSVSLSHITDPFKKMFGRCNKKKSTKGEYQNFE
ncbi:Niemann-Pick C1 protein, putative [Entamoeba histolytica HM-1:IMSS-B]|uniref:Niemann-Pick C1 protein, putative n=5 Tax=Entamoeba histolytica TaxID=5759 RepID=C4M8X7_ENTH1|nr:Niemann-Pick C1 protein, putative [Entamoeba histolytica HM-1:IMSS]EMD44862.1 niemannPick C1 protein precursor, putative [Entamoeba histolytica KU27]EMH75818.1 Niemann-Pick C1 protein, putative [Entamoeba histolytica HM-1:IMSS-B]ENY64022.1 Niemann-Pick C1 protein, putative [Entamoeba histolytica HM-1:IMSS-A]GAT98080.1 niemann-pick c1 protein putative [Entamoeba histolytica]EAL44130.1 Niemann-Pick C1 protein, putative [Entamoeba histolytica HM-1:IMSS]|eukprot:XP_649516.1 Niemann-Pick C1 protein, putative [Entamoeba histolytica HM-1:IMSS]